MPNLISAQEPDKPAQRPSVGRIVHYVSYGTPGGEYSSTCRAAVIVDVNAKGDVDLAVLNPTGLFFNAHVPYDAGLALVGGSWHWPERV